MGNTNVADSSRLPIDLLPSACLVVEKLRRTFFTTLTWMVSGIPWHILTITSSHLSRVYQGDSAWSLGPSPEQTRDQTCPAQAHTFMLFMLCFSSKLCGHVSDVGMHYVTTFIYFCLSLFVSISFYSLLQRQGIWILSLFDSDCMSSCPCIS